MAAPPPWTPAAAAEAAARRFLARTGGRVEVRTDLSSGGGGGGSGFVARPVVGLQPAVIYALERGDDLDLRISVGAIARVDRAAAFAAAADGADAVPLPGLKYVAVDMLPCPGLVLDTGAACGAASSAAAVEADGAAAAAAAAGAAPAADAPGEEDGVRGWTVLARTPTSSLPAAAEGVKVWLLRDGRLRVELSTGAFALAGAVRPALLAAAGVHHVADASAPMGTWFQVRQPIQLVLDVTAGIED